MSSRRAKPAAPHAAPAVTTPSAPPARSPRWLKLVLIALTALTLMAMFSGEIADPDAWIHFATGRWMVQHHQLPIPDPFAWTTYMGQPVYGNEYFTRDFNLKHEWLGQVVFYLIFAAGGPVGMVLFRAACVSLFCGITGWIVYRRTGAAWTGILATLAGAQVARMIANDRPYVVTYLLIATVVLIYERRRPLWVLVPLFVFWANFHGGFFAGWVVLGAYCGEALLQRLRGKPPADERALWGWSIGAFFAGGLNPAFFGIIPAMFAYRQSFMQNTLREWHVPALNDLSAYPFLLVGAAAMLVWARRRVRPADWIMYLAFALLSLMAQRNIVFLAMIGPLIIFSYLPPVKRVAERQIDLAAAALAAVLCVAALGSGRAFQLRVASWKYPDGAIAFLKRHNISAPMFNLYEWGGYLMWAAWPQEKTFVDGRALNESVFRDYWRVARNFADAPRILDQYGVQVILLEGFEYGSGVAYKLGAMLAAPSQTAWKLVYQDQTAMLFMRQPPAGVQPLPPTQVFDSLDAQCSDHLSHQPEAPRCALGLGGDLYPRLNMVDKSRYWLERYVSLERNPDPAAQQLLQQLQSGTFHAPQAR
jgi:hypothetical protein